MTLPPSPPLPLPLLLPLFPRPSLSLPVPSPTHQSLMTPGRGTQEGAAHQSSLAPSGEWRLRLLMAPFWPTRRSLRRSSIGNLLRSSSLLCSRSAAYYTRTDRCEQTATVGQLNNNALCVTHMHKLYDNPISSTRDTSRSCMQVTFSSLMCETCSEPFTQLWELLLT